MADLDVAFTQGYQIFQKYKADFVDLAEEYGLSVRSWKRREKGGSTDFHSFLFEMSDKESPSEMQAGFQLTMGGPRAKKPGTFHLWSMIYADQNLLNISEDGIPADKLSSELESALKKVRLALEKRAKVSFKDILKKQLQSKYEWEEEIEKYGDTYARNYTTDFGTKDFSAIITSMDGYFEMSCDGPGDLRIDGESVPSLRAGIKQAEAWFEKNKK